MLQSLARHEENPLSNASSEPSSHECPNDKNLETQPKITSQILSPDLRKTATPLRH